MMLRLLFLLGSVAGLNLGSERRKHIFRRLTVRTVRLQLEILVQRFLGTGRGSHLPAAVGGNSGEQRLAFEVISRGIVRVGGNRLIEGCRGILRIATVHK